MKSERSKLSRYASVARAMDYLLKRWTDFIRFLEDGRICLTTDGAEKGDSSACSAFARAAVGRFLPGGDHPLVGSFGTLDIVHSPAAGSP